MREIPAFYWRVTDRTGVYKYRHVILYAISFFVPPNREFPLSWVKRHMERAHFSVIGSKNFTILHSESSIIRQIRVGQSKLSLIHFSPLKSGLEKYLNDLE